MSLLLITLLSNYSTAAGHQARAQRRRLGEGQGAAEERRITGHERPQLDGVPYRGPRDEDLQWMNYRLRRRMGLGLIWS